MADQEIINPRNVSGMFYNDTSCIDCDFCREMAPHIFTRDDDEGLSYVYKQPTSPKEIEEATEALEGCPSNSIGIKTSN